MYSISVQHTGFCPDVQVLACILVCIGMYWVSIGHVFKYNTCWFQFRGLYCYKYCGMYWYVLICIGLYEHIYACIWSQIDCKHSNLVPYCTWIHFQCNIYCWYCRNEFVFGFSVHTVTGWSEGKTMAASSPRLNHVVTFTPRRARIQPALHAVWNGAVIASWYQRQESQEAGLEQSRQGLGR